MYIPKDFEWNDQELVLKFLEQHPFGSLTVNGPDGFPAIVHIPFTCEFGDSRKFLEFHVAKANTIIPAVEAAKKGKLVVLGAHGYVSSAVYTHVNVPTYNYEAVHVSGRIEELTQQELKNHLTKLVDSFEAERENKIQSTGQLPVTKVKMSQWPVELMDAYMQEIVGYRIEIQQLEAGFKLSQNRNETDFNRILDDLNYQNSPEKALAEAMKHAKCPIQ